MLKCQLLFLFLSLQLNIDHPVCRYENFKILHRNSIANALDMEFLCIILKPIYLKTYFQTTIFKFLHQANHFFLT